VKRAWLLIIVLAFTCFSGCREADSQKIELKEAAMDNQRPAKLSIETLEALTRAPYPTICVVQCEKVEVIFPGTQSESNIVFATVKNSGLGLEKGPCSFRFFASDSLRMKKGRLYLVAAYGSPGRRELSIFERVEVSSERAAQALDFALQEFERIKIGRG